MQALLVDSYIDLSGPFVCLSNSLCMHAWVRYFLGVRNDPDLLILDFGTLIRVGLMFHADVSFETWDSGKHDHHLDHDAACGVEAARA